MPLLDDESIQENSIPPSSQQGSLTSEGSHLGIVITPKKKFNVEELTKGVEEQVQRITTTVTSKNDATKILRYDLEKMVKFGAFVASSNTGTVFTMDNFCWQNLATVLIIVLCSFFVVKMTHEGAAVTIDEQPMEELLQQFAFIVPPTLSFYATLILTRWWSLRLGTLQKVFDSIMNISLVMAVELRAPKWAGLRLQVLKYAFCSIELFMQAAQRAPDLQAVVEMDYLTPVEAHYIDSNKNLWQRPMVMWSWILNILMNAMDHEKTPGGRVNLAIGQCCGARNGMTHLWAHLDTQLPFAYTHLVMLLVNLQSFLIAIKSGIICAKCWPVGKYFTMGSAVGKAVIVAFVYQALIQICYVIVDPFGDDVLDFPIVAYQVYVAGQVHAINHSVMTCPAVAEDGTVSKPRHTKISEDGHSESDEGSSESDDSSSSGP